MSCKILNSSSALLHLCNKYVDVFTIIDKSQTLAFDNIRTKGQLFLLALTFMFRY